MSEFKADDPEVRQIAAIFALNGWTWGGLGKPEETPRAEAIAATLNDLLDTVLRVNGGQGSSTSGRLFVESDPDFGGFGFGITYERPDR